MVRGGFDAADDRIVESVVAGDIVITTDIPLADRCIRAGARVLGPKGVEFTEDAIGERAGDPRPARHAQAVGRIRRRARPVRQGRPLEVPREARRADPRGAPSEAEARSLAVTYRGAGIFRKRICSAVRNKSQSRSSFVRKSRWSRAKARLSV